MEYPLGGMARLDLEAFEKWHCKSCHYQFRRPDVPMKILGEYDLCGQCARALFTQMAAVFHTIHAVGNGGF